MQKTKGFIGALAILLMTMVFAACAGRTDEPNDEPTAPVTFYDGEGHLITLHERPSTIVSIGPSNTEIIMALGFGDGIVAADDNFVEGLDPAVKTLSMWGIDMEHIISLNPDIIIASSMILFAGDPLTSARDLGIAVVYIPSSDSIEKVKDDIRLIARIFGEDAVGEALVADMAAEIADIERVVQTIETRRTVYFEISASPFTAGGDTFLNELIEIAGGINIFADQQGWPSPSAETILERNPEVILTSTNYLESDPVDEILGRAGWGAVAAVQNGDVFFIDTDTSSRSNHNVVHAIREIAQAIYPEYFE